MSTDEQTIPCDVVLLPESSQAAEAIHCSQLLASQGTLTTLDDENFYAHASLYMFQLSTERLAECKDVLREIATKFDVQELAQAGYYYQDTGGGKGYVDIMFDRNATVDQLQKEVVTAFNPLRGHARKRRSKNGRRHGPEARKSTAVWLPSRR